MPHKGCSKCLQNVTGGENCVASSHRLPARRALCPRRALTGSPARINEQEESDAEIRQLAALMGAQVLVLNEDDPQVAPYVVKPREVKRLVEPREADVAAAQCFGAVLAYTADLVQRSLPPRSAEEEQGEGEEAVAAAPAPPTPPRTDGEQGEPSNDNSDDNDNNRAAPRPTRPPRLLGVICERLLDGQWMGQAEAWIADTRGFVQGHALLSAGQQLSVQQCLQLLGFCLDTMQVIQTVGYEYALRCFVRQLAPFALPLVEQLQNPAAGNAGAGTAVAGRDAEAVAAEGGAAAAGAATAGAEGAGGAPSAPAAGSRWPTR